MSGIESIEQDYYNKCAEINFFPNKIEWDKIHASEYAIKVLKQLIAQERASAKRQGIFDPEIENKTDEEIIEDRIKNKKGSPHQEMLNMLSDEIRTNAELVAKTNAGSLNYEFHFPWYCGEYPLPSFDAHCEKSDHGALILIYTELCQFVYSFIKVFYMSNLLIHHTSFNECVDKTITIEPILSHEETIRAYAKLAGKFIRGECCGSAPYESEASVIGSKTLEATMSVLRFAIAHECGHILAGHISNGKVTYEFTPMQEMFLKHLGEGDKKEAIKKIYENRELSLAFENSRYWDYETIADQYGLDLCLIPCWPLDGTLKNAHEMIMRLSGPLIFFSLHGMLHKAAHSLRKTDITGNELNYRHPPSYRRSKTMQAWVKEISCNSEMLITNANCFSIWLRDREEEIYNYIINNRTLLS
ncbi:MAG: hypothetical protein GWN67_07685 [Phycisphaerae bacterium]|nr:hypothetical protein [Phycisphaerae bacterium]NIP54862.1 hypothetical protein [Phycisphaerae bacterium]NIS52170.1 hypothetical protein [Phycisphaerae bacterium]NIU11151.1 hypothetical protein [Phycisphaerae bacterium]NIU56256.1 hypothetical protein [Phycisphaerae bacterium]